MIEERCTEIGPFVGVPRLQRELPSVARRELASILASFRERHVFGPTVEQARLVWHKPGRVWAMDFTNAPAPIDGIHPYILAVRDLGSGRQLAAIPTTDQTAETVRAVLEALFAEHGPPLVLKSDNGSGFVCDAVRAFLERCHVHLLLSPARTPAYNGACEAGIGGLKTRAHHVAAQQGRAGFWTSDDVERARLLGNSAPERPRLLSADDHWESRSPVTSAERELFNWVLEEKRRAGASERIATRQALQEVGLLSIRWRRNTLPINPGFLASNS